VTVVVIVVLPSLAVQETAVPAVSPVIVVDGQPVLQDTVTFDVCH
jgi:hypothetical protein